MILLVYLNHQHYYYNQKEFKEIRFFINNLQLTINNLPEAICAE